MRVQMVDHARKSPGKCGRCGVAIEIKSPYRWAKGRYGPKMVRCMSPSCSFKQSELTTSEYSSRLLEAQEAFESAVIDAASIDDLKSAQSDAVAAVRELSDEQREKLDNMPEGLQQGDTGQLLEQRADACESLADELEGVDIEEPENTGEEEWEAFAEENDMEQGEDEEPDAYEGRVREQQDERIKTAVDEAREELQGVDWSDAEG